MKIILFGVNFPQLILKMGFLMYTQCNKTYLPPRAILIPFQKKKNTLLIAAMTVLWFQFFFSFFKNFWNLSVNWLIPMEKYAYTKWLLNTLKMMWFLLCCYELLNAHQVQKWISRYIFKRSPESTYGGDAVHTVTVTVTGLGLHCLILPQTMKAIDSDIKKIYGLTILTFTHIIKSKLFT